MNKEIELEKKFAKINNDEINFEFWVLELEKLGFEIVKIILDDTNNDTYYDTSELHFYSTDKSIRIRKKPGKSLIANLKNDFSRGLNGTKRNEFKDTVTGYNYIELINSFKKYDHMVKHIESDPKLIIENKRKTIVIRKYDINIEFSIDDVLFIDPSSDISVEDKGIEFEVKNTNNKLREIIKDLEDLIIKTNSFEEESYNSKYQKGLSMVKREQKTKKFT